jgi:Flp pilus assembly protein TadB
VPALRSFGLAVVAQLQSGGNLADTTDRLSQALIERARVRRRARTIVAYSRMATQILLVLPLAAIFIMSFVLDGYAELLLHRAEGNVILGMAALMVVAGLVLVQRFGRIDLERGGTTR